MNQALLEKQQRLENLKKKLKEAHHGSPREQEILSQIEIVETEIFLLSDRSQICTVTELPQIQPQQNAIDQPLSSTKYINISIVAFMMGLGLVMVFWFKIDTLIANVHVFYMLLLLLSISVGVFGFGMMTVFVPYKRNILSRVLKFGVTAVLSVLVVAGGVIGMSRMSPFALTVYVHGSKGEKDVVPDNEGIVILAIGNERLVKGIHEDGVAYFPIIPAKFRQQPISVTIIADGVEVVEPDKPYILTENTIDVEVRRNQELSNLPDTAETR